MGEKQYKNSLSALHVHAKMQRLRRCRNGAFRRFCKSRNLASRARLRTQSNLHLIVSSLAACWGRFPPSPPGAKSIGILYLKALAPLGLHHWLSLAEKKKTSAKYF